MYIAKPNEKIFELTPIGVSYICEHCHEGEMVIDSRDRDNMMRVPNPSQLINHRCNKCNGVLALPKPYPYIEWTRGDNLNERDE